MTSIVKIEKHISRGGVGKCGICSEYFTAATGVRGDVKLGAARLPLSSSLSVFHLPSSQAALLAPAHLICYCVDGCIGHRQSPTANRHSPFAIRRTWTSKPFTRPSPSTENQVRRAITDTRWRLDISLISATCCSALVQTLTFAALTSTFDNSCHCVLICFYVRPKARSLRPSSFAISTIPRYTPTPPIPIRHRFTQ